MCLKSLKWVLVGGIKTRVSYLSPVIAEMYAKISEKVEAANTSAHNFNVVLLQINIFLRSI